MPILLGETWNIKFNRSSTAISRLNQYQNIKIDFENAKNTIPTSGYYTLKMKESLEILNKENSVCNDVLSYDIPEIWFNILKISNISASECTNFIYTYNE